MLLLSREQVIPLDTIILYRFKIIAHDTMVSCTLPGQATTPSRPDWPLVLRGARGNNPAAA
jgi:hypothetical protein